MASHEMLRRRGTMLRGVVHAGTGAAFLAALLVAAPARADVVTVTTAADDPKSPPAGSLRQVLTQVAKPGDTIRFSEPFAILLKSRQIVVPPALTGIRIEGPVEIAGDGVVAEMFLRASGAVVDGVQFRDATLRIQADDAGVAEEISGVTVRACTFTVRGGVEVAAANTCAVEGCTFRLDARSKDDRPAIEFLTVSDSRIAGNTFEVLAGKARAIDVGVSRGITVDGNVGASGDVIVNAVSATLVGNRFETGRLQADTLGMAQEGPFLVEGNTCRSLAVLAVDATVSDNVVGETPAGGRAPSAALAVQGYRVAASAHEGPLVVAGNRARGGRVSTLSCIADAGTSALTVRDNVVTEPARQGVLVSTSVPATVTGNTVMHDGAKGRGVGIALVGRSGASIALDTNTVSAIRGAGFEVRKLTTASFFRDRAVDCAREGVVVFPGATAAWSEGTVDDNGGDGFFFAKGSRGGVLDAVVRGNRGAGVFADAGSQVLVSRTSFSGNGGAGIDLAPRGVTPNAKRKKANSGLGWPTELEFSETSRGIEGKTVPYALIEVHRVEEGAREGNPGNGEGATYVAEVVADEEGEFTAQFPCSEGELFTVTATLPFGALATSEFSEDLECSPGPGIEIASVSDAGVAGDDDSVTPGGVGVGSCVAGGGRWLVFTSDATNLVPGDTNELEDVFLRDTQDATTVRITRTHHGGEFNPNYPGVNGVAGTDATISEDGRFIAYATPSPEVIAGDEDRRLTVVLFDRTAGTTIAVTDPTLHSPPLPSGSEAHLGGRDPEISGDGSVVAFISDDEDWVPADLDGDDDVFVWTRATGAIERVSVATGGAGVSNPQFPGVSVPRPSHDGRFVAFGSWQALVPGNSVNGQMVFLRDRQEGTTVLVSADESGAAKRGREPAISGDGRYVAFVTQDPLVATDDPAGDDVYVFDRETGTRRRVSLRTDGTSFGAGTRAPTLSADGRFLAFTAPGSYDIPGGPTIVGVPDLQLVDLVAGTIAEASVGPLGEALGDSFGPCLSRDGRTLVFVSSASNLVPVTTGGWYQVYLRRLPEPE